MRIETADCSIAKHTAKASQPYAVAYQRGMIKSATALHLDNNHLTVLVKGNQTHCIHNVNRDAVQHNQQEFGLVT